jgi:hypothetical protein
MEDTRRMQIRKPIDNLVAKRPNDFVFKLAIFPQYTSDRTSGNVLQEAIDSCQLQGNIIQSNKLTC